jgi:hypothetical protein
MFHACLDAVEAVVAQAARSKGKGSGPKWPSNLILGEADHSRVSNGEHDAGADAKSGTKSGTKNRGKRKVSGLRQ